MYDNKTLEQNVDLALNDYNALVDALNSDPLHTDKRDLDEPWITANGILRLSRMHRTHNIPIKNIANSYWRTLLKVLDYHRNCSKQPKPMLSIEESIPELTITALLMTYNSE